MLGTCFIAFLVTVILAAIITSAGDELRTAYLRILDALHKHPPDNYYEELRKQARYQ